jgi:hypothetical protein
MYYNSAPSRFDLNSEIRRNMLRAQLVKEFTHVALPTKYSGIDMLIYTLPLHTNSIIHAVPIQLATMGCHALLRDFATWRTTGLLVILLEDPREPKHPRTFALTAEELALVQMVGLIDATAEGKQDGGEQASALRQALEPYAMVSGGWHSKISRWVFAKHRSNAPSSAKKSALS